MLRYLPIGIVIVLSSLFLLSFVTAPYSESQVLELVENTDRCLLDCHAIVRVKNPSPQAISLAGNFYTWYEKEFSSQESLKEFKAEVLTKVPYSRATYSSSESKGSYLHPNGTLENYSNVTITQQTATEYRDEYLPFSDVSIPSGGYKQFKISGKKPLKFPSNYDWKIAFFLQGFNYTPAWAWWNQTYFPKRQTIQVQYGGLGSYNVNNAQVRINVPWDSGMRSDFGDLRFIFYNSTQGNTEADYYINDSVSSSWADVWVKVPYLTNSANATVDMYYGDSASATKSNRNNTLDLYVDFAEDNTIDSAVFDIAGNPAMENRRAKTTGSVFANYFRTKKYFNRGMLAEAKAMPAGSDWNTLIIYDLQEAGDAAPRLGQHGNPSVSWRLEGDDTTAILGAGNDNNANVTAYFAVSNSTGAARYIGWKNSTVDSKDAQVAAGTTDDKPFHFSSHTASGTGYWDRIVIRKYLPPNTKTSLNYSFTSGNLIVSQYINGTACTDCVLYQGDFMQLAVNLTYGGSKANATGINATVYLQNGTNWTRWAFLGDSSFARTDRGHIAHFTVNSTPGSYRLTVEADANSTYNSNTNYFNVSYAWWDRAWGKRRMVNVTNVNGTDIPFAVNMSFGLDVLNCTREVRVVKYNWLGGESSPTNTLVDSQVYNETYYSGVPNNNNRTTLTYCNSAYISWKNTASNDNLTHFIYYSNPIVEKSESRMKPFFYYVSGIEEAISSIFFDSHTDLWWNYTAEELSSRIRDSANITYNYLINLNYKTQARGNPSKTDILSKMPNDKIYWFYGHGGIIYPVGYNETAILRDAYYADDSDIVTATNINSSLSQFSNMKLAMVIASFAGDNSTTLQGCILNNWLSNAFKSKGADCYIAFLGFDPISQCNDCNCGSDVQSPYVDRFNKCFWSNITSGYTINESAINATKCTKGSSCSDPNDCVHATLVERYTGACNQKLMG